MVIDTLYIYLSIITFVGGNKYLSEHISSIYLNQVFEDPLGTVQELDYRNIPGLKVLRDDVPQLSEVRRYLDYIETIPEGEYKPPFRQFWAQHVVNGLKEKALKEDVLPEEYVRSHQDELPNRFKGNHINWQDLFYNNDFTSLKVPDLMDYKPSTTMNDSFNELEESLELVKIVIPGRNGEDPKFRYIFIDAHDKDEMARNLRDRLNDIAFRDTDSIEDSHISQGLLFKDIFAVNPLKSRVQGSDVKTLGTIAPEIIETATDERDATSPTTATPFTTNIYGGYKNAQGWPNDSGMALYPKSIEFDDLDVNYELIPGKYGVREASRIDKRNYDEAKKTFELKRKWNELKHNNLGLPMSWQEFYDIYLNVRDHQLGSAEDSHINNPSSVSLWPPVSPEVRGGDRFQDILEEFYNEVQSSTYSDHFKISNHFNVDNTERGNNKKWSWISENDDLINNLRQRHKKSIYSEKIRENREAFRIENESVSNDIKETHHEDIDDISYDMYTTVPMTESLMVMTDAHEPMDLGQVLEPGITIKVNLDELTYSVDEPLMKGWYHYGAIGSERTLEVQNRAPLKHEDAFRPWSYWPGSKLRYPFYSLPYDEWASWFPDDTRLLSAKSELLKDCDCTIDVGIKSDCNCNSSEQDVDNQSNLLTPFEYGLNNKNKLNKIDTMDCVSLADSDGHVAQGCPFATKEHIPIKQEEIIIDQKPNDFKIRLAGLKALEELFQRPKLRAFENTDDRLESHNIYKLARKAEHDILDTGRLIRGDVIREEYKLLYEKYLEEYQNSKTESTLLSEQDRGHKPLSIENDDVHKNLNSYLYEHQPLSVKEGSNEFSMKSPIIHRNEDVMSDEQVHNWVAPRMNKFLHNHRVPGEMPMKHVIPGLNPYMYRTESEVYEINLNTTIEPGKALLKSNVDAKHSSLRRDRKALKNNVIPIYEDTIDDFINKIDKDIDYVKDIMEYERNYDKNRIQQRYDQIPRSKGVFSPSSLNEDHVVGKQLDNNSDTILSSEVIDKSSDNSQVQRGPQSSKDRNNTANLLLKLKSHSLDTHKDNLLAHEPQSSIEEDPCLYLEVNPDTCYQYRFTNGAICTVNITNTGCIASNFEDIEAYGEDPALLNFLIALWIIVGTASIIIFVSLAIWLARKWSTRGTTVNYNRRKFWKDVFVYH